MAMSWLKSTVSNYLFGASEEIIKGKIYLNNKLLSENGILFLNSFSVPYKHELVLKEGGKLLKSFFLRKSLKFQCFELENKSNFFQWMDGADEFKFLVDDTELERVPYFVKSILYRIFEYEYQKPGSEAKGFEMSLLERDLQQHPPNATSNHIVANISLREQSSTSIFDSYNRTSGDLYKWDLVEELNCLLAQKATFSFKKSKEQDFATLLQIIKDDKIICSELCTSALNLCTNRGSKTIGWNSFMGGQISFWSFQFVDEEGFDCCNKLLTKFVYEYNFQQEYDRFVKNGDTAYLTSFLKMEVDDPANTPPSSDESDDDSAGFRASATPSKYGLCSPHKKNMHLVVSRNVYDRAFVSRGNEIAIFSSLDSDDANLAYYGQYADIRDKSGSVLTPQKLMLHHNDRAFLILNQDDPSRIHKMDIEYGKVVDEYTPYHHNIIEPQPEDYFQTVDLIPTAKKDHASETFIGLGRSRIYHVDPRAPDCRIPDKEMTQYTGSTQLTCGATTRDGYLVVGTDKGEIKLFTGKGKYDKRAKTALPGLGDPIIGIDVTTDGKWILATCEQYLLVVSTFFAKNAKESLGFVTPMGSHKPTPIKLTIQAKHVALMNEKLKFTRACFDLNEKGERFIVASTGHFAIQWDFQDVQRRKITNYVIKKFNDVVVSDQFTPQNDRHVVVATQRDIGIASREEFKTPTKKRLSVVNSPY
ncbi:VID27-like protein isoform X2 [Zophobas morio]|uniref:VID27-like protein isoform X2 n=1 Tax=Zophobas morio TaxID=2755281 RepID=UPI003083C7E7